MNERLQQQLEAAIRKIESRKQSEKILLLGMLLAGLVLGYLTFVYDPLAAEKASLTAQISNVQAQIQAQQSTYASMVAASQEDPTRFANDRLRTIARELQTLDAEINALAGDLVTPNEMTQILTSVLSRYSGLELIRFQNTPARPLRAGLTPTVSSTDSEGLPVFDPVAASVEGQVFEHGLVLEFQGDYFTTLKYLRFLEEVTGSFFWDAVTFRQTEWPTAHVTLEIHTLSTNAGFIGV